MKIEDLKQLIQQTEAEQQLTWEKYQAASASVNPFRDHWLSLYDQIRKLRQKLEVLEEIEREKHASTIL